MSASKPVLPLLAGLVSLTLSATAGAVPLVDRIEGALAPQACGGTGCWTNHLRVTDLDGDGDLDLVFVNYPDFFQGNDNPQPLVVYFNDGAGNFTNVSAEAVGGYVGNLRQVAIGDVDGDGFPDIYGADGAGNAHVLFINDGTGHFVDEADLRLPNDYPQSGASRMADVNGDGHLDIFAADGYAAGGPPFGRLYINDGTGVFEEAIDAIPNSIMGVDIDDVEFLDVDRDFDLDLIVNAHAGGIGALWLNDGNGTFSAGGALAPPVTANFHYNVAPCDVDGDGDLDLWVENIGGGFKEQLQINDGSGNFTDETAARVTGSFGADDNGVICVDVDNDGDFDAVVLSLQTPERLLANDGTGHFTLVPDAFPAPTDCTLWGEFGDLDGDGRLDLVTGQGECGNTNNQVYFGNADMPVDTTPPKIIAVDAPGSAAVGAEAVALFAVSDSTVTDEGPRLSRAYAVVNPDGAATEVDGWFVGGDLFRVLLPTATQGSFSVALCAEDRSSNVACSDPVSFQVGDPSGDGDGDSDDETGETGPGGTGDEGGCACSLADERGGLGFAGLSLLGLLGLVRRRRS